MTTEQFNSLKLGIESGLISKAAAEKLIGEHEAKDIAEATRAAKAHAKQIRTDLGLTQPVTGGLSALAGIRFPEQPLSRKPYVLNYGLQASSLSKLQADDCANGRNCRSTLCFNLPTPRIEGEFNMAPADKH